MQWNFAHQDIEVYAMFELDRVGLVCRRDVQKKQGSLSLSRIVVDEFHENLETTLYLQELKDAWRFRFHIHSQFLDFAKFLTYTTTTSTPAAMRWLFSWSNVFLPCWGFRDYAVGSYRNTVFGWFCQCGEAGACMQWYWPLGVPAPVGCEGSCDLEERFWPICLWSVVPFLVSVRASWQFLHVVWCHLFRSNRLLLAMCYMAL